MIDIERVLADLVAIDTTAPRAEDTETMPNYLAALKYLEPLFQAAGCETELLPIPKDIAHGPGRWNLIARQRRPGKPRSFIYGHTDVVPADEWPEAFVPRLEEGKLFGRGAADMKGCIVGALAGLDLLKDRDASHDITMLVTTDEETDQMEQLRYLFNYLQDQENIRGSLLLDVDSMAGGVDIACLGAYQFEIVVTGKAAHSGSPHLGVNAVEGAIRLGNKLLELQEVVRQRTSTIYAEPGCGIAFMKPALNIDIIEGGKAANQIPAECRIVVDRRFIPEEEPEDVVREIHEAFRYVTGVTYEIKNAHLFPAWRSQMNADNARLLEIVRSVTGEGEPFGVLGSGDVVMLEREFGLRLVGTGAIRPDNDIHGKNEFVYLKDVEDLAKVIEKFFAC